MAEKLDHIIRQLKIKAQGFVCYNKQTNYFDLYNQRASNSQLDSGYWNMYADSSKGTPFAILSFEDDEYLFKRFLAATTMRLYSKIIRENKLTLQDFIEKIEMAYSRIIQDNTNGETILVAHAAWLKKHGASFANVDKWLVKSKEGFIENWNFILPILEEEASIPY